MLSFVHKKVLRRMVAEPIEQTDPPQFFPFEWWEVDIDAEMRRAERRRKLALILSIIAIVSSLISLLSVGYRLLCLAS